MTTEELIAKYNQRGKDVKCWKARAEKAETKLKILADKFPGVAETIEDLIEKEETSMGMKSEERNRVIDDYLEKDFHVIEKGSVYKEAIRECDKLARAWDVVMKHGTVYDPVAHSPRHWEDVHDYMESTLSPPQPKDPLEELNEFVEKVNAKSSYFHAVSCNKILAEIHRLRGKK